MPTGRRRTRKPDPLASPEAVRSIIERLRRRMPGVVPALEPAAVRFLYAVSHVERYPATDTNRGRPTRHRREDLIRAARELRAILSKEGGRVGLASFVTSYTRILKFPSDVTESLTRGDINLFEAAQVARLTPARLGCNAQAARSRRKELVKEHVSLGGSRARLQSRVRQALGEAVGEAVQVKEAVVRSVEIADELLEVSADDSRHLLWEEIRGIVFGMREVTPEDLDKEPGLYDELLDATGHVAAILHRFEKKRRAREQEPKQIEV